MNLTLLKKIQVVRNFHELVLFKICTSSRNYYENSKIHYLRK